MSRFRVFEVGERLKKAEDRRAYSLTYSLSVSSMNSSWLEDISALLACCIIIASRCISRYRNST